MQMDFCLNTHADIDLILLVRIHGCRRKVDNWAIKDVGSGGIDVLAAGELL
jgi:hypothetical protein